jgi:hypothetical protein
VPAEAQESNPRFGTKTGDRHVDVSHLPLASRTGLCFALG